MGLFSKARNSILELGDVISWVKCKGGGLLRKVRIVSHMKLNTAYFGDLQVWISFPTNIYSSLDSKSGCTTVLFCIHPPNTRE